MANHWDFFMSKNKRIYINNVVYEIITNTWCRIPIFTDIEACQVLRESIWKYQKRYDFIIFTYSIAPCHLNILFKPKKGKQISDIIRDIKVDARYRVYELIEQNKLYSYHYLCGQQCFCKSFKYQNSELKFSVTPGHRPRCGPHTNDVAIKNDRPSINHYYRAANGKIKSFRIINPAITKLENFKQYKHLWDTGFYDHYIRNQEEFIKKLNYFYYNNNKHHLNKKYDELFKQFRYCNPKYFHLLN